jgi:cytochrome bd ubiquinol oxidase subunit II
MLIAKSTFVLWVGVWGRGAAASDPLVGSVSLSPPLRPLAMAAVVFVALVAYTLLGGADFGGGVWDLLARGPRGERQRSAIAHAIGPIWEANHVWLVLVVVLLFTCFPAVFADLSVVLHIPLALMLVGIVLRGSAFAFRAFESTPSQAQRRLGHVFAAASIVTPLVLGMIIGAIVSGRVGGAPPAEVGGSFTATFIAPWVSPFTLIVGLFALSLFAFLAAVYLTVDTEDEPDLQEDFRVRALAAAAGVFVTAGATLAVAHWVSRGIAEALIFAPVALALQLGTAAAAVTAIVALVRRQFRRARVAAAAQVALILTGWAFAQYPYLVPPTLTIRDTAAPASTLDAVFVALGVGALILFPALGYLFRVFKAANPQSAR